MVFICFSATHQPLLFDDAFYHVMLRGNGGDTIFFDYEDREKFLDLISESVTDSIAEFIHFA